LSGHRLGLVIQKILPNSCQLLLYFWKIMLLEIPDLIINTMLENLSCIPDYLDIQASKDAIGPNVCQTFEYLQLLITEAADTRSPGISNVTKCLLATQLGEDNDDKPKAKTIRILPDREACEHVKRSTCPQNGNRFHHKHLSREMQNGEVV
jgi:hypothetical protein